MRAGPRFSPAARDHGDERRSPREAADGSNSDEAPINGERTRGLREAPSKERTNKNEGQEEENVLLSLLPSWNGGMEMSLASLSSRTPTFCVFLLYQLRARPCGHVAAGKMPARPPHRLLFRCPILLLLLVHSPLCLLLSPRCPPPALSHALSLTHQKLPDPTSATFPHQAALGLALLLGRQRVVPECVRVNEQAVVIVGDQHQRRRHPRTNTHDTPPQPNTPPHTNNKNTSARTYRALSTSRSAWCAAWDLPSISATSTSLYVVLEKLFMFD